MRIAKQCANVVKIEESSVLNASLTAEKTLLTIVNKKLSRNRGKVPRNFRDLACVHS